MKTSTYRNCASAAALALATVLAQPALAQDAAPADTSGGGLDEIVVTASGRDRTKLESSVSVTSITADTIQNFQPTSEAEVFRMIPGIQVAGTSGPGGNSNIAVRGLPVATGGSPFVQIQEDGLPTVLFGDIQFGNNDYWTRFDATVANVEGVRGGSASTYASQAPGAVINYISHDGRTAGGYVQLNKGINFNETKIDARYGGPIGETTFAHIGGYFKRGHGPRNDFNVSKSLQIKANLTQEFGDGDGYVRLFFKHANTQEPNYTGAPAYAELDGKKVSNIEPFDGFDGRDQSNYSSLNRRGLFYGLDGTLGSEAIDGITTKALSGGAQFHYELGENFTVDNNFRATKMDGAFASPFLNVARTSSVIGSTLSLNGTPYATVASIRYASGPKAGQVYTGAFVDNNVNVRTNIRDIGSLANDLTLAGKFDMGLGKLTARAGLFYMDQDIAMDWHVNKSLRELSGNNPAQLDLYDAAGAKLTQQGISGYNNNWGNCCARNYDLSYTNTAPYLGLDIDADAFAIDGSVRFDKVKAKGWAVSGGSEFFVNSGGVNIPAIRANGTSETLDYSRSYTSYSVGALWKASSDTSLFVRTSRGGRFNGDRQTLSGKFNADGSLNQVGRTASVDFVNQHELGLKTRGDVAGGRYSLEVTLLKGDFKQSTYELSAIRCPGGAGGCVIDANYKSHGAEFFATFNSGGLSLITNATWAKAKKRAAGATSYQRADGMPDLMCTISANYDASDLLTLGLVATGQSSTLDGGGYEYPGGILFNGNVQVRPLPNVELGVQVYNLLNRLDFRNNVSGVSYTGVPSVIYGTPVVGRTFTGSVRVTF